MHFDKRDGHGRQGVSQGNAGMGIAARIDDDEGHPFAAGGLDAIDQIAFVVALEADQFDRGCLGLAGEGCVDVRQCLLPVDFRLACPEEVQVGAMHHQDALFAFGIFDRLVAGFLCFHVCKFAGNHRRLSRIKVNIAENQRG